MVTLVTSRLLDSFGPFDSPHSDVIITQHITDKPSSPRPSQKPYHHTITTITNTYLTRQVNVLECSVPVSSVSYSSSRPKGEEHKEWSRKGWNRKGRRDKVILVRVIHTWSAPSLSKNLFSAFFGSSL